MKYILILLFTLNIFSQENNLKLINSFNFFADKNIEEPNNKQLSGIKITPLKESFVTLGETFLDGNILTRHKKDGKIIWQKYFKNTTINDIKTFDNKIYAVGYKHDFTDIENDNFDETKVKLLMYLSIFNSKGKEIQKFEYKNTYGNYPKSFYIDSKGNLFISCSSFLDRTKNKNQISILKISNKGIKDWEKKISFESKHNHGWSPGIIQELDKDNLIISVHFQINNQSRTELINISKKGVISKSSTKKYWLYDTNNTSQKKPIFFGNNIDQLVTNVKDTIKFHDIKNGILKKYISKYEQFNINTYLETQSSYFLAGNICNNNANSPGKVWSNHEDIYIVKLDKKLNFISDYSYNYENIDRINDLIFIDNTIYAIGESWFDGPNNQIGKMMKILVFE